MSIFWDKVQKMRKQSKPLIKSEKPVKNANVEPKKKVKKPTQKTTVIKAVDSDDNGTGSIT